jgi:hypothetical protein
VNTGIDVRTIVSRRVQRALNEDIIGKKVAVLVNLAPKGNLLVWKVKE